MILKLIFYVTLGKLTNSRLAYEMYSFTFCGIFFLGQTKFLDCRLSSKSTKMKTCNSVIAPIKTSTRARARKHACQSPFALPVLLIFCFLTFCCTHCWNKKVGNKFRIREYFHFYFQLVSSLHLKRKKIPNGSRMCIILSRFKSDAKNS